MVNGMIDSPLSMFKGIKGLVQEPFLFENSIEALSQGVFIRVAVLGHTDLAVVVLQYTNISLRTVLNASIGMVHERLMRELPCGERLLKCLDTEGGTQRWAELVADDFSRVGIGNQNQVAKFVIDADVGNITDPELFGSFDAQLCGKIGVFFEPMPAVGGRNVFFATPNEQIMPAQQGEKLVAARANAVLLQLLLQQMEQLATAHTRVSCRW